MKIIAHIYTDFDEKFGIPRQSGLVEGLKGEIVFEPEFRNAAALKGLREYSHLWILWQFSMAQREGWSATVRPPRLGGNKRMGVFATRSPFRPNPIGLSCVRLEEIRMDDVKGPVIVVSGIDMMSGTPIYDIKPYLPYCDSHPEAAGGFAEEVKEKHLQVQWGEKTGNEILTEEQKNHIEQLLAQDPRTAYVEDENRIWGMNYAGYNINFKVKGNKLCITQVEKQHK